MQVAEQVRGEGDEFHSGHMMFELPEELRWALVLSPGDPMVSRELRAGSRTVHRW